MSKGHLFVISGSSGVGKSSVLKEVMARRSDLQFSVSATSRPPDPVRRTVCSTILSAARPSAR